MHVLHKLHRSTRPAFQARGRTTTTTKYIESNAVRKSTQQTAPYATAAAAPTKIPHDHKQYKIENFPKHRKINTFERVICESGSSGRTTV